MTITGLSQIYGCKVTKVEFLEWCLLNPDSIWGKKTNVILKGINAKGLYKASYTFAGIIECFKVFEATEECDRHKHRDRFEIDPDVLHEILDEIFDEISVPDWNSKPKAMYHNGAFGIYKIPHDTDDGSHVIAGMRISYVHTTSDEPVPVTTQLPFNPSEEVRDEAQEEFDRHSFMDGRVNELFLVQNDCYCCS
jgi:hypothetical protein